MLYDRIIYSLALKDIRKKRGFTIEKLADISGYSMGTISTLENSLSILTDSKTSHLLDIYHLDKTYLTKFDDVIEPLIDRFIDGIYFIDNNVKADTYQKIMSYQSSYLDTSLRLCFDLVGFLYTVCTYKAPDVALKKSLKSLLEQKGLFSKKYQAILLIYAGAYYDDLKEYEKSKLYLEETAGSVSYYPKLYGLHQYFLTNIYIQTGDVFKSVQCSENAVIAFKKENNIRRLLNIQITMTIQRLKVRQYDEAIEQCFQIYNEAKNHLYYRVMAKSMYNAGYAYLLKQEYSKAEQCFNKIPSDYLTCRYCLVISVVYLFLNNDALMNDYCKLAMVKDGAELYQGFINALYEFGKDKDTIRFIKKIERIIHQKGNTLNNFDYEFYLLILIEQYKAIRKYKKVMECYEELYHLMIHQQK